MSLSIQGTDAVSLGQMRLAREQRFYFAITTLSIYNCVSGISGLPFASIRAITVSGRNYLDNGTLSCFLPQLPSNDKNVDGENKYKKRDATEDFTEMKIFMLQISSLSWPVAGNSGPLTWPGMATIW